MKTLFLALLLSNVLFQLSAQDYLSTQGTTLPGTVYLTDGKTVSGKVSYNSSTVFIQPEGSQVVSYSAAEVTGFGLQNGGGEFLSIASGKKGRYAFYETVSSKNPKFMLVSNANSIDKRGKEKDENGIKIVTRYYFYASDEKQLVDADLKDVADFLKTRCEGISTAITEYKDKNYHYGPLASKDEIKRKLLRIVDDYVNNRCTYVPKDY
ncbi:hypothetical protein [Chryseosolibacter indicus]|uniref:DUF4369 domain-containing protein n=1 Tax=Chryseosolibacter indicus TaxID=2782351 RepID=A0ABS5VPY0_9BACT|nr:hypothetical protein [Chryseosolibacter indicus]MBT1703510.1 hypothetical protein [Chryseosolibacter indicus]